MLVLALHNNRESTQELEDISNLLVRLRATMPTKEIQELESLIDSLSTKYLVTLYVSSPYGEEALQTLEGLREYIQPKGQRTFTAGDVSDWFAHTHANTNLVLTDSKRLGKFMVKYRELLGLVGVFPAGRGPGYGQRYSKRLGN